MQVEYQVSKIKDSWKRGDITKETMVVSCKELRVMAQLINIEASK